MPRRPWPYSTLAAFRSGVGVRAAHEHRGDGPAGFFGNRRLRRIGHLAAHADVIDESDDGAAFSVLESEGADVERIVDITRGSRAQLKGDDGRGDLDRGSAGVET